MGVGYLVLRNDLDPVAAGAEQPRVVRAALAGSPGLRRVSGVRAHRAVEVFAVPGATPPLTTRPAASALALSGGPEGTVGAAGAWVTARRAAARRRRARGRSAGVVVSDTGRRRSLGFGYAAAVPRVGADGEPLDAPTIWRGTRRRCRCRPTRAVTGRPRSSARRCRRTGRR